MNTSLQNIFVARNTIAHSGRSRSWRCSLALVLLAMLPLATAQANVYVTDIKLNSGTNLVTTPVGSTVNISYILNEAATAGATIEILSGTNVVGAIAIVGGNPGTIRGTNTVAWSGKDAGGNNVTPGTYSIRITAAANGYADWTQITSDANPGNYVWAPRGIAVNNNTNSPFYGRVFVGNARQGPNPTNSPGDKVGIQKLNADGSPADEGVFSDGGYPWAGDFFSPWKMEVSADDKLYVSDWSGNGIVLAFDQVISPASLITVLRQDNWPPVGTSDGTSTGVTNYANFSGPFVTGSGTNTQVWMADISYDANTNIMRSVGIRRWNVTTNGAIATNDLGKTMVQARGTADLNLFPFDVAVDKNGKIYTIQYRPTTNDTNFKVFRYPANPSGATALTNAEWKVGGSNVYVGAYGIAVNPAATYVAVALREGTALLVLNNPPISVAPILSATTFTNGQFQFTLTGESNVTYVIQASTDLQTWIPVVTNTASDATRSIIINAPDVQLFYRAIANPIVIDTGAGHDHRDAAWDNAGNLYDVDNFASRWRAYSPPGPNQATTVAVPTVQVTP